MRSLNEPPNTEQTDAPPLHLDVQRALARFFPMALDALRSTSPFDALGGGEWAVLVELLRAWSCDGETPNQAHLARVAGYSVRGVRAVLDALGEGAILVVDRAQRREPVFRVGPVLEVALTAFAEGLDRRLWTRGMAWLHDPSRPGGGVRQSRRDAITAATSQASLRITAMASPAAGPSPEAASIRAIPSAVALPITAMATVSTPSGSPLLIKKKNLDLSSSRPPERPPEPAPVAAQPPTDGQRGARPVTALRAAACRALAARYRIGFPEATPPTTFAAVDVDRIVLLMEGTTLSDGELDQLHVDAIQGAIPKSKSQPPSVSFIWGKKEYFDGNVQDGRAKRQAANPPPRKRKPKPPEEPPASLSEVVEFARRALESLSGRAPSEHVRPQSARFLPPDVLPPPAATHADGDDDR
jgi:hypothetical protein